MVCLQDPRRDEAETAQPSQNRPPKRPNPPTSCGTRAAPRVSEWGSDTAPTYEAVSFSDCDCGFLTLRTDPAFSRGERETSRVLGAPQACMPVSVDAAAGTFTYTVRVETGTVGCGPARTVVREAALGGGVRPGAMVGGWWRCSVGQDPQSWAMSCAKGKAIVLAYGPVREQNPWVIAQARLRIGALAPTSTVGLALRHVRVTSCPRGRREVHASRRGCADDRRGKTPSVRPARRSRPTCRLEDPRSARVAHRVLRSSRLRPTHGRVRA